MTDLIAFLNVRLDADEASAREAMADPGMAANWNETTSGCLDVGLPDHGGENWRDYVWLQGDSRVTRFIALHDPARMLREVEAGRALLAEHEGECCVKGMCCGEVTDYFAAGAGDPCPTLRILAAIWRGHPDYRQEWKP